MVMQLAARDLDAEECEALIRRGVPRNCRGIQTVPPSPALFGRGHFANARALIRSTGAGGVKRKPR